MNNPGCACGSGKVYASCCEPYHQGWEAPPTAEALMRSRYSAYARQLVDYIEATSAGDALAAFSKKDVTAWARAATFTNLAILGTERGGPDDDDGVVDFAATYDEAGKTHVLRERSQFVRMPAKPPATADGAGGPDQFRTVDGAWRYVGGTRGQTVTRAEPRVGRNDPCPCGSGLKYKKCHGA